ncbi:hypothetical protein P9850_01880 [Anoxybacillus rupiensis]|uniref:Uncharacterized protein n=1 Tax=Anoxybacteroides rupiense TaxID=311460 RepID=A0ABD5IS13_9BACL|nr:hypothetical protein [Anoxybacillus rupiensis]
MTKEWIQEQILKIVHGQEQEIDKLLETKRGTTDEVLYIVCEQVILQKQRFIEELRTLL